MRLIFNGRKSTPIRREKQEEAKSERMGERVLVVRALGIAIFIGKSFIE